VTYTALVLLAVPVVVIIDLAVLRTRLVRRKAFWVSYAIVLFFQFLFNGVLTGFEIVRYDDEAILGTRVFWAPVEDVAFGFAMITLTLCVWVALGRRTATRDR
jgi:lycopene cyclase domain-containing protein